MKVSIERIKQTKLWIRTLKQTNDTFENKREELRASFFSFREKAANLASQIAVALPGLTQHDISHLDALWEVADLICGDNYPLSPLEAYVFGGAVLLHDSALCYEAYEDGLNGIRSTVIWKDSYASASEQNTNKDEAEQIADFSALRALHAHQAELLAERYWLDPDTNSQLFLIENNSLRKHLGKLIGQIAASHHWPIEEVASKLSNQVNAPPGFPREWRINPIKIACILRCSDAAHIDNERAPDFLHALIKRRGVSFKHWQAQNKLALVDLDQSDDTDSTLLFTSTHKFLEHESEAWWIAYDTICMIDKEIRSSNALLETNPIGTPQFQVKRVKGVESPELMAKHIQTEGWAPCVAEVHVGNIENLVKSLGGEKLYGESCDKLEVIIRELMQNGRDSIHARREADAGFSGQITIRLKSNGENHYLYIEDDGVGMSKRVLTGPLLDFGTSFWTSSLVQSEFPGLRSSKFKSIGQFGIGFYSVFMGADKVKVASKPWNGGSSDIWQLNFNSGLSLRPLLKNEPPKNLKTNTSTQVKLHLKPSILKNLETVTVKRNTAKIANLEVSFIDYFSAICAALDVDVNLEINDSDCVKIHTDIRKETNFERWLSKISFSKYQSTNIENYIKSNAHRLRPIIENDQWHGLAAISTIPSNEQNFLSMNTVGGLSTNVHHRSGENYIGHISYLPLSAKREGQIFSASDEAIKSWAEDQVRILEEQGLNPIERCFLAHSLCHFGVDPSNHATVAIVHNEQVELVSFRELAILSTKKDIVFVKSDYIEHIDSYTQVSSITGKAVIKPLRNSNFLSLEMEEDKPKRNNSILDCLYREIIRMKFTPSIRIEKGIGVSLVGQNDGLIVRAVKRN